MSRPLTISIQTPPDMPHHKFRRLVCSLSMRAHYGSTGAYAKELGVSRALLDGVIGGWYRSARVEAALSKLTGYPVSVLWPKAKKAA